MYKRKFNRYKRYRRWKKWGGSAMSVAKKALAIAKSAKVEAKPEYKIFDLSENNVNVDYNGYLPSLCIPAQGDTDALRNGDRIKIANCTFRYKVARNGSDQPVRVMLLYDKQVKVGSSSDILEMTGAFANATLSPKNYDKRFQTQILYDRVIDLTTNNPIQEVVTTVKVDKYCQFNIGTTTVNTGRLLALFISNVNANTPQISYFSRVTFADQ